MYLKWGSYGNILETFWDYCDLFNNKPVEFYSSKLVSLFEFMSVSRSNSVQIKITHSKN